VLTSRILVSLMIFFVLPEIEEYISFKKSAKDLRDGTEKPAISINYPHECFYNFTKSSCKAIVIGAPGAGKSTWSKWLQRETLKPERKGIGIRVELRDYSSGDLPSAYELVRKEAGKQMVEDLTPGQIRRWIENSQITFIFDGFDEIKPTERDSFQKWLLDLAEFAIECSFVVTSRPLTTNHLDGLGKAWKIWNINPFDEERIIKYISIWHKNTPLLPDSKRDINGEELASSWLYDPMLGTLTGNPLLLSTLLMVHHLDGRLPNGRANLYKRYVDGMLGYWDERYKHLATEIQLTPDDKRKIIRGIALYLFLTDQETIDENVLVEWLDKFLPTMNIKVSATDALSILRERSGLLIGPGIYSFAHKSISEFLVAETVLQGDQLDNSGKRIDRFHLFEHRNDDRWNTVLFLWAGMTSFIDLKSFIDQCVSDKNWGLAYGLLLDQYDRFPLLSRQELLNQLKLVEDNYKEWTEMGWKVGGILIQSYTFEIRGLSSNRIDELVIRVIQDNTIDWKGFSGMKGKIYDSAWLNYAIFQQHDAEKWKDVITDKLPRRIKPSDLKKFLAHLLMYAMTSNLNEFLLVFRKVFPDFYGYTSLVLIERLIYFLGLLEKNVDQVGPVAVTQKTISEFVETLLNEDLDQIIPHLPETKSWNYEDPFEDNKDSVDLLALFSKVINQSFEKGFIDIETKNRLLKFSKRLLKLRMSIVLDDSLKIT
jgi:hypothetical protein